MLNNYRKYGLSIALGLLIAASLALNVDARAAEHGETRIDGDIAGTAYTLLRPEAWNGDLVLMVHGSIPAEFELLALLMASPGRVYSRLEILEELQGTSFEGIARTVDVHIRNLRTKIEPDSSNPIYVETVFGVGYRFRGKA